MGDLLAATSEQLVGIATIRSYGVQQRMRNKLNTQIDQILKAERRASMLSALNFSSTVLGQSLATGLALIGGTYLALRGDMTVGTVVAFPFLVYMFAGPADVDHRNARGTAASDGRLAPRARDSSTPK